MIRKTMKKFVHLSLFFMGIINRKLYVSGGCTYYEQRNGSVFCNSAKKNDDFPDKIFTNITYLQLDSTKSDQQRIFTKLDTFTGFYKLTELKILGGFLNFAKTRRGKKFSDGAFQYKNVESLFVSDCEFFHSSREITLRLKLPPNLENITLKCPREVFDWSDVKKLTYLEARKVGFLNLSEVAHPSAASLTELHTEAVDNILRIHDIAYLCRLNIFSFDYDMSKGTTLDHDCECEMYREWKDFLSTEEKVTLEYKTNTGKPLGCSSVELNCSNYTLDEAKQNRTKCLRLTELSAGNIAANIWSIPSSFWSWAIEIPWYIYAAVGVSVLIFGLTSLLFLAKYMLSSRESNSSTDNKSNSYYDEDDMYD